MKGWPAAPQLSAAPRCRPIFESAHLANNDDRSSTSSSYSAQSRTSSSVAVDRSRIVNSSAAFSAPLSSFEAARSNKSEVTNAPSPRCASMSDDSVSTAGAVGDGERSRSHGRTRKSLWTVSVVGTAHDGP